MKLIFSKTGSSGNVSVIESKNGNILIIDCGIKYKTVDKAIGYRLHKAEGYLLTHNHKDHSMYEKEFAKAGIENVSDFVETESFVIRKVEMVHSNSDGTPCECYGYLIVDKSTGEKMLWSTDTQYIKNKFSPLDFYCIECNYFETEEYDVELDYIEKSVEMRRAKSHMSCESVCKFLEIQDLSKCKEVFLLHISGSIGENGKIKMLDTVRGVLRGKKCNADVKIMEGV